jgi:hypothetical protein
MPDFAKIEKLIEAEIKKLNVPEELGESPKWSTHTKRRKNWHSKRRPQRKKR